MARLIATRNWNDSLGPIAGWPEAADLNTRVMAVGLPGGMNGRQLAETARIARRNLKVLFITGYADNAAVGRVHLEPGMQVLARPFAMSTLANNVREMLEA